MKQTIWENEPDLTIAPIDEWIYDEESSEWFYEFESEPSKAEGTGWGTGGYSYRPGCSGLGR
jgi:hypothetical protein